MTIFMETKAPPSVGAVTAQVRKWVYEIWVLFAKDVMWHFIQCFMAPPWLQVNDARHFCAFIPSETIKELFAGTGVFLMLTYYVLYNNDGMCV